jgi:hypothetical protein
LLLKRQLLGTCCPWLLTDNGSHDSIAIGVRADRDGKKAFTIRDIQEANREYVFAFTIDPHDIAVQQTACAHPLLKHGAAHNLDFTR